VAKFRKKPIVVDAFQWFPSMGLFGGVDFDHDEGCYFVVTIHGDKIAVNAGDWVITEPDMVHHYPCKDEVFRATYEPVE
jgi:hypothetical protein